MPDLAVTVSSVPMKIRAHEDQRDHPAARTGRLEAEAHNPSTAPARTSRARCGPGLVSVAGGPGAAAKPETKPGIPKQAGPRKEAAVTSYAAVLGGHDVRLPGVRS